MGKINLGMTWFYQKGDGKIFSGHNLMTTEGLAYIAGLCNGETQAENWRIAIYENDFTEAAAATYATPGTMTECTAISQAARPIYTATKTGAVLSSETNKASFDFTATKTIYGVALVCFNGTEATAAITAFSDYSGTVAGTVLVTSSGHGLTSADVVKIAGTTSYNGTFIITVVDANTYYVTTTWVTDDATGTWTHKPVAKKGDIAAGAGANMIDVYNFGSGNEKTMDSGETLKVWGTFTLTDA